MLFFGYSPFPPFLRFYVVDASGKVVRSDEIDIPRGVMMHDFQIADRNADVHRLAGLLQLRRPP